MRLKPPYEKKPVLVRLHDLLRYPQYPVLGVRVRRDWLRRGDELYAHVPPQGKGGAGGSQRGHKLLYVPRFATFIPLVPKLKR